mgnify:CR=1 FL=1
MKTDPLRCRASCLSAAIVLGGLLAGSGCSNDSVATSSVKAPTANEASGPIIRVERATGLDAERVALGKILFDDRRLSGAVKTACSSCHDLAHGGADHTPLSSGASGQPLAVNTPTVFNAALNFRQFWDGRASSLEEQIDGPLLNPQEMGSSWTSALTTIQHDGALASRFAKSYPLGVTEQNVKDALATFERSLATPDAPFDRYLGGDTNALDATARHGYELFKGYGCS